MQEVAVQREGRVGVLGELGDAVGGAVEVVADDGVAQGLDVDADLMGAAGLDSDFDEGEGAVGGVDSLEDVDSGRRRCGRPHGGWSCGCGGRCRGLMGRVTVMSSLARWPWTRAM